MRSILKRRKGQEFSFAMDVLPTLVAAAIATGVLIFLITLIFRITNDINTNQQIRDSIVYASALMGNKQLVYEEGRIHRGLLDSEKLNLLRDPRGEEDCTKLRFRYHEYTLKITDIETGQFWQICSEIESNVQFAVAIRYPDGTVHKGIMHVGVPRFGTIKTTGD